VVVYQHSAVGRDLLVRVLESLGATAIAVARSGTFVPVDTEDLHEEDDRGFRVLASQSDDSCLDGRYESLREATDPLKAPRRFSSTNCAPDVPAMIGPRLHQPRHAIVTPTRMVAPCSHRGARLL
jgi:hypothetical protein